MSKRTTFTTVSPLPPDIPRQVVLDFLHNHQEMIDLNPLVIERHPIAVPGHAPPEETRCVWWSLTDKISYMPGVKGDLTYLAAFQDLHDGIRTHCYAPMGTHIRERWSLGGTLPGEPPAPVELGLGVPSQGLYLREDVEVRCNFLMAGFVKKTILKAHGVLVEKLTSKARAAMAEHPGGAYRNGPTVSSPPHSGHGHGHGGGSGGARSSSTHNDQRTSYFSPPSDRSSNASTPEPQYGLYSKPLPQLPPQNGGGLHAFYGNQRAAASDTGLAPEQSHSRQASGQYHMGHGRYLSGQGWQDNNNSRATTYIHDPYDPNNQSRTGAPQLPPVSQLGQGTYGQARHAPDPQQGSSWPIAPPAPAPHSTQGRGGGGFVAELGGSETHISELG